MAGALVNGWTIYPSRQKRPNEHMGCGLVDEAASRFHLQQLLQQLRLTSNEAMSLHCGWQLQGATGNWQVQPALRNRPTRTLLNGVNIG